ncbi:MAG: AmmeMemoRadiSam system protein A [Candidatus Omnitrophica bacterium]|nr:AmmeMemoRadiSam system protein A [Candidatus Omnitrophota bacterium]
MLNKEERDFLLRSARNAVKVYLETGRTEISATSDPVLKEGRGVFVTLHKEAELRGCIGFLESGKPLHENVCVMAVEAAVADPRFPAVTLSELAGLKVEISILTKPVKVSGAEVIVMGRDGVIVHRGNHQGVFLPQVAEETGWDKEKFLSVLCADKAGLPSDAWKYKDTELYTFQAEVFKEE